MKNEDLHDAIRNWTKMKWNDEGLKTDLADEFFARGFTAIWIKDVAF